MNKKHTWQTWRFWINGKGYYDFKSRLVYSAYYDRVCGERGVMFDLERKIKDSHNNPHLQKMFFGQTPELNIKKAIDKIRLLRLKFGNI